MANRARAARTTRESGTTSRRYNGYSEYYSHSSEAYDVYDERYSRSRPVARQKTIRRKRISNSKPKFLIDMSNRSKIAFMPYLTLAVFFVGLIAVVFSGVRIIEMRMEINELSRQHQNLVDANTLKNAQLAKSLDLKEVENVAMTRLGMVKPAQHQIVHVSIPRQNYVIQNLAAAEETESIFAKISAFSKRVFAMAALW